MNEKAALNKPDEECFSLKFSFHFKPLSGMGGGGGS